MSDTRIQCPKCSFEFSVTEALSSEIETKYSKKFEENARIREADLQKQKNEFELKKKALDEKTLDIDKLVEDRLKAEKNILEKKVKLTLQNEARVEIEDLKRQVVERSKEALDAQNKELELRKKTREIEAREKSLELEIQRKFDLERKVIEEEVTKKIVDDQRLNSAEKDKQLDDMRKQISDLKRKAEQGSQQAQGEILELEIETSLKAQFPLDQISEVPKGMAGGDLIHKVMTSGGHHAGTIVWETKRTKSWSDGWIDKLKSDQRAISAEFAVIVSQVMPKGSYHLLHSDGVWVSDFQTYQAIALALRANLLQLYHARAVAAGKGEKMDFLYSYLTGTQFRQRIEVIVESFRTMREDLDREKRAIQKSWAARDQQINRVMISTVGMYGDVQGIVGASLPKIAALEIEAGTGISPESEDEEK